MEMQVPSAVLEARPIPASQPLINGVEFAPFTELRAEGFAVNMSFKLAKLPIRAANKTALFPSKFVTQGSAFAASKASTTSV